MSDRRRMTAFEQEIKDLETKLAAKKAAFAAARGKPVSASTTKKATDDAEIKSWADQIKQEDDATVGLMGQIKALEDQLEADDVVEDEVVADEMVQDDEGKPAVLADDQNDKADNNWPVENVPDMANKNDAIMAEDKEEEKDEKPVEASAKKADDAAVADVSKGIEDEIEKTHQEVSDEVAPNAPGVETHEVVNASSKAVSAKQKFASLIKQATTRLDRVAQYLEQSGKPQLAYKIDRVSDALEAKLK